MDTEDKALFLVDTHCHIHEPGTQAPQDILVHMHESGVQQALCVGTSEESSRLAVAFANMHKEAFAVIGVHPHDSKDGWAAIGKLAGTSDRIVGVGEIGLDYYYDHSPREVQIEAFKAQLQVAMDHDLPVSFHVREAFDDLWHILGDFPHIKGVMHSFTDSKDNLERALKRGFYIGVNGISTFTKDESQKELFDSIPLDRLLLETDAPFLTPAPYRGKINEPAYIRVIAEYHAGRRGISVEELAAQTTKNAHTLFARMK